MVQGAVCLAALFMDDELCCVPGILKKKDVNSTNGVRYFTILFGGSRFFRAGEAGEVVRGEAEAVAAEGGHVGGEGGVEGELVFGFFECDLAGVEGLAVQWERAFEAVGPAVFDELEV